MATLQLHFLQDPEGAAHTLDQALASSELEAVPPEAQAYLEFAVLYAQAGRPGRALEQLAAFRAEAPAENQEGEGPAENQEGEGRQSDLRSAEAAIALAEGNPGEAVRLSRQARALVPKCDLCSLPEIGEAFEAASMPDSAVAAYEAYLESKTLFRSRNDNVKLHRVLLGLGRSYEAMGQPERAADHYRWLLELWSDADPGLQPRVEELREKLGALGENTP
jgi:tetratricopeptide (TPR) repeat protein